MSKRSHIETLFVTKIYRARLGGEGERGLLRDLAHACRVIAADDAAGQDWCRAHGYRGYTSYASLQDLAWRDPAFAALQERLDGHVAAFVREVDFAPCKLTLDSLWINILEPGGVHAAHIHPRSVVSGTIYLEASPGAARLKFEDPRLPLMMAAPARRERAAAENRTFAHIEPSPGLVVLWESWLRHEVLLHAGDAPRIGISFNYA
jgi:uncharacterized protein (TIGR02466 family)